MPANTRSITVLGAGILGLWQALTLARAGHRVRLIGNQRRAVRACGELLRRRHAGAGAGGGDGAGHVAPARPRGRGAVAQCLSGGEGERQHRRGGARATAASWNVSPAARRAIASSTPRSSARSSPIWRGASPRRCIFPHEAHMPAPAALAFMLAEVQQAGVEIDLRRRRRAGGRRDDHRLPRAWRRAMRFRTCAACAASVP